MPSMKNTVEKIKENVGQKPRVPNACTLFIHPQRQRQGGLLCVCELIFLLWYHMCSLDVLIHLESLPSYYRLDVLPHEMKPTPLHPNYYSDSQFLLDKHGHQKETRPTPFYLTEVSRNRSCSLLKFPNNIP